MIKYRALFFIFAASFTLIGFSKTNSITYPGLGTFSSSDFHHPIWHPFGLVPQSPDHIDPLFMLFTRNHKNHGQRLLWNDTYSIIHSDFNATRETKIIVHGYIDDNILGIWMTDMKNVLLDSGDYNIIVVDWHKGGFFPYTQATANTRVVGAMIGFEIKLLCATTKITPQNFHILGHSLGAHIAGFAGKFLDGQLGHITGLDPAGPYYEGVVPQGRLWHTDAKFVESIHTDARHLFPTIGFGMYETFSHVDFYPNGGKVQPGCNQERITTIIFQGAEEGMRRLVGCNHQRACDFYMTSIKQKEELLRGFACDSYDDFIYGKCTSCGTHGENCATLGPKAIEFKAKNDIQKSIGKRFFLSTGSHSPFFQYHYAIRIRMADRDSGHMDQHGKIHLTLITDHADTFTFDFNDKDRIFHLGKSYSKVVLSEFDPLHLHDVSLEWSKGGLNIFKSEMAVNNIEIIGMNPSSNLPIHKKFCNHSPLMNIENGKRVFFRNC